MDREHAPPDPPRPAARPAGKRRSPLRVVGYAAMAGAFLGVWVAKRAQGRPFAPAALLSPMGLSLALWLVMSVYWSWAARNQSPAKSSESASSRALHLLLVNVALVVSYWPFAGWPSTTRWTFEFPRILPATPYLPVIGLGVATGSLLLALWARHHLGRNWSAEVTLKRNHELVRTGPYRRIRHPIYTGAIGMYVGTALISGRLQGPLSLALIAIAYARKIRQEEHVLRQEFGAAYDDYRRESWAVIPWVV